MRSKPPKTALQRFIFSMQGVNTNVRSTCSSVIGLRRSARHRTQCNQHKRNKNRYVCHGLQSKQTGTAVEWSANSQVGCRRVSVQMAMTHSRQCQYRQHGADSGEPDTACISLAGKCSCQSEQYTYTAHQEQHQQDKAWQSGC